MLCFSHVRYVFLACLLFFFLNYVLTFLQMIMWVVSEITSRVQLKARVNTLQKFIQLGQVRPLLLFV